MLLGARFMNNVASVNAFDWALQTEMTEGSGPVTVYFQLVDKSLDRDDQGFRNFATGRRYMPASGATLQVILKNIADAATLTKVASQAFPTSDPSIWSFQIASSDLVKGTVSMTLVLTEGSKVTKALVPAGILVYSNSPGDC